MLEIPIPEYQEPERASGLNRQHEIQRLEAALRDILVEDLNIDNQRLADIVGAALDEVEAVNFRANRAGSFARGEKSKKIRAARRAALSELYRRCVAILENEENGGSVGKRIDSLENFLIKQIPNGTEARLSGLKREARPQMLQQQSRLIL